MPFTFQRKESNSRFKIETYIHDGCGIHFYKLYDNIQTENHTFSLEVRTPPENSKGIEHIIEHSVLCGSQHYNVKEPFKNLLESSFETFLNAMTSLDHTAYPIASTNYQDFYNMVSVYLDAIFAPNLIRNKAIFLEEGVNHKFEDGIVKHSGIVLNEMLANYSDVIQRCMSTMEQMLMKGTFLEYDSGGNPDEIVTLTYEELLDYYFRFYQPRNMSIVIHGRSSVADDISMLDHLLERYTWQLDTPTFHQITRFEPVTWEEMATSESDDFLCFGGIFGSSTCFKSYEVAILYIIRYLLFDSDGAIITNYFEENDICDSMICDFELRAAAYYYSLVLEGVDPDLDADEVRTQLCQCLREICGLERGELNGTLSYPLLEAVLEVFEFESMELSENYTVDLCNDVATGAFLNGDEMFHLEGDENNKELRSMLESGQLALIIKQFVQRFFVDEKMSVLSISEVDREEKENELESCFVSEPCADEEELLRRYHEEPDLDQDLAELPLLHISQINTDLIKQRIEASFYRADNDVILIDNLDSKIIRLNLLFDISGVLNAENSWYFCLIRDMLFKLPTSKFESEIELETKIDSLLGGYEVSIEFSDVQNSSACSVYLVVEVKFQRQFLEDAVELVRHVIGDFEYSLVHEEDRVQELLNEIYSDQELYYESDDVYELAINASIPDLMSNRIIGHMDGQGFLDFLQHYSEEETALNLLITEIRKCIKCLPSIECRCAISAADCVLKDNNLISLIRQKLCQANNCVFLEQFDQELPMLMRMPITTNYVSASYRVRERTGAFILFAHYLETQLCWDAIRVRNGAYGCIVMPSSGFLTLVSYRDANIAFTIDFFKSIRKHTEGISIDEDKLDKLKIGCLSKIELPETAEGINQKMLDLFYHRADLSTRLEWIDDIRECTVCHFMRQADCIQGECTIAVIQEGGASPFSD